MSARSTVVATGPLALQAVTQHMLDHRLPAPRSITLPSPGIPAMELYMLAADASVWLESPGLHVLSEKVVPLRAGEDLVDRPRESVHLQVTIPSPLGDVAALVKYFRVAVRVPFTVLLGGAS